MKNLIIAILLVTNLFYSINGEFTCKNVDPITDFQKEKVRFFFVFFFLSFS